MAKIKVVASTGLVPVRAIVGSIVTPPGAVFGVTPLRLPVLLAKKEVALIEIDDDIETIEVEVELAAEASAAWAGDGDENDGSEQFVLPEGWREKSHLVLIPLAKKLDASASTKAAAIAVLEAYEATLKPAE